MPVTADRATVASYAQFPAELDRHWLGRVCHLSGADLAVIQRRTDPVTQLGYATQLVTVRAIGTFQSDPAAVPGPVVAAVARQLGIDNPDVLARYRDMPVRWRHSAEIRDRYGYRDFSAQPDRFAFTVWLYRQAWADEVAPSALFRAAHRQLLARRILLPGQSVLTRLIATVRERATHRVHDRLARAAPPELRTRHARMRSLLDVLDEHLALGAVLEEFRIRRAGIEENMSTVKALMRPPGDPFHERLVASYPQIRRFLPRLIEALERGRPVLDACQALGDWLTEKPRTTRRPAGELPLEVVTPSWQRHVRDTTGTVDRAGYACCVLDQLRICLRRRDVYAPGTTRWGDPRAELLAPETWTEQRDTLCEDLALDPDPEMVIGQLTTTLDAAWRRTAAGYAANPDLRIDRRGGRDEIVLTPLDVDPEPASLTGLRAEVEKLLPEVEIADLPLEAHGWTGFLDEYTHMAGTETRDPSLPETLSALLVSESCNVGLTPVAG